MPGMMSKAMAREAGQPKEPEVQPESPREKAVAGEAEEQAEQATPETRGEAEQEVEPNATPDEQAEYERSAQALYTFLYGKNEMTDSIAGQLVDGEQKVGSVAQASMLILKNLDEKIDMDETVIATITENLVEELINIGEAKGIKYEEDEMKQALVTAWEGAQVMFGGDSSIEDDLAGITTGMSAQELEEAKNLAQSLLQKGTGAGVPGTISPGGAETEEVA